MNVTKENIDELNAVLKVKLGPEDYESKVNGAIKQYQKKANMPGFRQGKVPAGLIKKMYGKSILVEELNKLLNDTIHNYIQEEKLEILGNPLPKAEENKNVDWDTQKEFEFSYDLGLAPRFTVDISPNEKFTRLKIKIDEALLEKNIAEMKKRYGQVVNPELTEPGDMIVGDFVELDAQGNIAEGGIFKSSSISTERFKNEELKKALTGLKKEDTAIIKSAWLKEQAEYMAAILGIEGAKAEALTCDLKFTIKNILRIQDAELNPELFDKVYGPGSASSIEEFRARVKSELEGYYEVESESRLKNDIREGLSHKLSISLPDEFLKRWLMAVNEKSLTYEQVSSEYNTYSTTLKWQLIENKILKDFQVKVSAEEARDFARNYVKGHYERHGQTDTAEEIINEAAEGLLKKEDEAKKIYDRLYDRKVMDLFLKNFTIEVKEVSFEEFHKK